MEDINELEIEDTMEIVEPVPKRKPGRPAGSKNKKPVVADTTPVVPLDDEPPSKVTKRPKRKRSPSSSEDSPTPRVRSKPPKRKSRTRVIVLSSSESEDAPPPVRVVRKPRVAPVPSSSEDEPLTVAPVHQPIATAPSRVAKLELNLQGRQRFIDHKQATYNRFFQHLA